MSALRVQVPLVVVAADDLGNQTAFDAGLVVSRWRFSFDGGSGQNGFALSSSGLLVVPHSAARRLTGLAPSGQPAWERSLVFAPTREVAVVDSHVFVLEQEMGSSRRSAFDVAAGTDLALWVPETEQPGELLGPLAATRGGQPSVAAVSGSRGRGAVGVWASYAGAALAGFGTTDGGPSVDGGMITAFANASGLVASDGFSIVAFTSSRGLEQLSPQSRVQQLPGAYTGLDQLIGRDGGYAGIGRAGGTWRTFIGAPPSTFVEWGGGAVDPLATPLLGVDGFYYSRRTTPAVCKTEQAPASTVCAQQASGEQVAALALGASKTLYASVTRAGTSVIQVRDSQTLALRDEIPLPGTVGACTSLMPTCLSGNPVLGCVDSVGTIVFISTDARGIDVTADWPMEGHDPGKTFNVSTSLTPFACP